MRDNPMFHPHFYRMSYMHIVQSILCVQQNDKHPFDYTGGQISLFCFTFWTTMGGTREENINHWWNLRFFKRNCSSCKILWMKFLGFIVANTWMRGIDPPDLPVNITSSIVLPFMSLFLVMSPLCFFLPSNEISTRKRPWPYAVCDST